MAAAPALRSAASVRTVTAMIDTATACCTAGRNRVRAAV